MKLGLTGRGSSRTGQGEDSESVMDRGREWQDINSEIVVVRGEEVAGNE